MSFKISEFNTTEKQLIDYLGDICETINQIIAQKKAIYEEMTEEEKKILLLDEDLTLVPFFDLSEEANIGMLVERANRVWGGSSFIPQMMGDSQILNSDQFVQVYRY
jgi:hypothetical protein